MAENLDPLTNLPEKSDSKSKMDAIFEKGLSSFTSTGASTSTLDTKELLKPKDVSKSIAAKSDPFEVQTIFKDELRRDTDWNQLFDKSSKRFQDARVARMEQLDAEQTYGEALNGMGKFAGKTLNRTVLGLTGTVYGLGAALFSWDADQIQENVIFDASEYLDKEMDKAMPIYTNEDEYYDKGFFAKIAYHPGKLLGDEVADGLSFAASAIGQELLLTAVTGATFGATSGVQLARTAKLAKQGASIWSKLGNTGKIVKAIRGIDKTTDAAKTLAKLKEGSEAVSKIEQYRAALGTGRGLLIGTNYEASMEARGAADEMRTALTQEYMALNGGRAPSGEALEKIEQGVNASKWAVYGTNLALLGASNLIQFPKVFWKGFNGQRKVLKEAGEEIMKEAELKALGKTAKGGFVKKNAKRLAKILKTPITEMLEETSQGITTNSSLEYYSRKYSANDNVFALKGMDAIARGSEEFFGSAEGSTSMGMGFLIGLLGVPVGGRGMVRGATGREANFAMAGGFMETLREAKSKRETIQKLSDELAKSPTAFKSIKASYENYVRNMGIQEDMDEAIDANDIFSFKNLEHDQYFSYVRSRAKADMLEMVMGDLKAMTEMDLETFNKEFRVEGITDFTEESKKDMIHKAYRQAKRIDEHSSTVDNLLDTSKINARAGEAVKETLIHAASTMVNTEIREKELIDKLAGITNLNEAEVIEISNRAKHSKHSKPLLALLKKGRTQELTKEETKERNKLGNRLGLKVGQLNELSSSEQVLDYTALKDTAGTLKIEATEEGAKIGVDQEAFMEEAGIMLNQWRLNNPTQATLKEKEALDLLLDIAKLKNRREEFISLYNLLVTPKGAAAFEKADDAAQKVLYDKLAKEAKSEIDEALQNAESQAELEAARDKAAQMSPEAVANFDNRVKNNANGQRKNVTSYSPTDIIGSLKKRYEEAPELFEQEANELKEQLDGILRNSWLDTSSPEAFAKGIKGLSNSDIWESISPVIESYYENAAQSVVDETELATVEDGEIEIVSDEIGGSSMILGPLDTDPSGENPLRSQGHEYEYTRNPQTGEIVWSKDKTENVLDIDWDYVNNSETLKQGTVIKLEVNTDTLNDEYHTSLKEEGRLAEGVQILLVAYDAQGNRHVVGGLSAAKKKTSNPANEAANKALIDIRELVLKTIKGKKGIVDTGLSTTVSRKDTGRINIDKNIKSKEDFHSVKDTLKEGEELILGVGIPMVDGAIVRVPNSPDVVVRPVNGIVPGAVYAIKKSGNGTFIPVRVSTRKVNEDELSIIEGLLNDINALDPEKGDTKQDVNSIKDKIKEIVYLDLTVDLSGSGKFKIITYVNGENRLSAPMSVKEILEVAKEKVAQVNVKKINTGEYNKSIDGDKITTNLSVESNTHSTSFVMDPIDLPGTKKAKNSKSDNAKPKGLKGMYSPDLSSAEEEALKKEAKEEAEGWVKESQKAASKTPARIDFTKENSKGQTTTTLRRKKITPKNDPKFKIATNSKKIWDKETSLKWLKKNVPNIPTHIVDDIRRVANTGGQEAWGVFHKAAIYIAENAGQGTAYHEAFHAIFNLYLSPSEQQDLLLEAQGQYGLTNDLELEEAMADDFAEFIMSNLPKKGLKAKIVNFFQGVWRFIQQIKGENGSKINQLFNAINNGYYSSPAVEQVVRDSSNPAPTRFKKIAGLNPSQKKARIDMINYFVMGNLSNLAEENPTLTDNELIDKVGIEELYHSTTNPSSVLGRLQDIHDQIQDALAQNPKSESLQYQDEQMTITRNNFFEGFNKDGSLKMGPLYLESVRALRKHGIKIKLSEGVKDDVEVDVNLDESDTFESWTIDRASTSTKDTTSYKVRKTLSSLDSTIVNKDGSVTADTDDIGFVKKIPFDEVFNSLKYSLTEHYTSEDMIATMKKLSRFNPHYQTIIETMESDPEFRASFFHTMATQRVDYTLLLQETRQAHGREITSHSIIDSNRRNPSLTVMSDWNALFSFNNVDSKGNVTEKAKENATKVKEYFKIKLTLLQNTQAQSLDATLSQEMSRKLQSIGIHMSPKELRSMYMGTETAEAYVNFVSKFSGESGLLNTVVSSIIKGNNPFAISKTGELTALTPFIDTVINNNPAIYEQSSINVEGKQVFANIAPNYVSKLITNLTGKDYKKAISYFRQDKFFRRNVWLNELSDSAENRNLLKRKVLDGYKVRGEDRGTKYTKMSAFQRKVTEIEMYLNGGNKGWGYYTMPILADAPQMNLVSFKKYNKEQVIDHLYQVALQEVGRNNWIKESSTKIENFTEGFYYFEGLNGIDVGNVANKAKVMEIIKDNVNKEVTATTEQLRELGIMSSDPMISSFKKGISDKLGEHKTATDFVEDYVYNSYLANIQMLQLFSGDTAFYKSDEDLSKRNKQIANPGNLLDVSVMSSETYNTLYLRDEKKPSKYLEGLKKALEGNPKQKEILAQYEEVNATDAQAYISLDRYKDIMKGAGLWTPKHDTAFENLQDAEPTSEDLALVLQPIKPFYFGTTNIDGKIVPVQNKNSEFLLLPQVAEGNPKLEQMLNLFERGVDSIQFESAVKVGGHKILELENAMGKKDSASLTKLVEKNKIVLNNSDYRIQLSVPEHHLDTDILFGTQIRKLILANMGNPDYVYTIGGKEMTSKEVFDTYQELTGIDIKKEYKELERLFEPGNLNELVDVIKEEVLDRGLAQKYIDALEIDKNTNKLKFPLYFPMTAKRNESLLNSLFKNRVTKQRIKGGSFVQLSDFGFSKELKVVFGERTDKKGNTKTYIKEMEALLPWWSKKYFPVGEDGIIDFERIKKEAPELLELVGFRIPTEDKYSMPVIRVVGFTAKEAGGVAVLPADITKIAGTDFDVDKLFIMMPEFEINLQARQLHKAIAEQYEEESAPSFEEVMKIMNTKHYLLETENDIELKEDIDAILTDFQTIERVPNGKDSKAARNNFKLDIVKGILQDPISNEEIINPGSFNTLKSLKERITNLRGDVSDKIKMHLPSSQLELFSRNMNGSDLIGIFANHNTNHAMLQHSNINITSPTKFNGEKNTSLHGKYTESPEGQDLISRVLAEHLAASVDNAKDPVLTALNINPFTADIIATIVRTGHSLETAMMFINQPIVVKLTKAFINGGAKEYNFRMLVDSLSQDLIERGANKSFGNGVHNLFNKDRIVKGRLIPGMETAIEMGEENADPTEQLKVITAFASYRNTGKAVANMVRSMRADSKGAGPTMAANEVFLSNYVKVRSEELTPELEGVNDFFLNSSYTMLKDFTQKGIEDPNKLMQRYFPWMNASFLEFKQELAEGKLGELTEKEIEHVNYSLLTYIASEFEFYNASKEDNAYMLYEFPSDFMKLIEKDEYLREENLFTKNLKIDTQATVNEEDSSLSRLSFNNTAKLSEIQKEEIEEAFEHLLDQPQYRELAEQLIKYSFSTSGFVYTPHSFNHLIPMSFFTSLRDSAGTSFTTFLEEKVDATKNDSSLLLKYRQSFYRNNFKRHDFTPSIDITQNGLPLNEAEDLKLSDNGVPLSLLVTVNKEGSKLYTRNKATKQVDYKPVIKYSYKGEKYLMMLNPTMSNNSRGLYYILPEAGKPGYLNEITRPGEDRQSVVLDNTLNIKVGGVNMNWGSGKITNIIDALVNEGLEDRIHISERLETTPIEIFDTNSKSGISLQQLSTKYQEKVKNNRKSEKTVVPLLEDNFDIPVMSREEIQEKISEIVNNSSFIELSKDEKYYINTLTGEQYQRVTSFRDGGKIPEENDYLKSATTIGSAVDKFVRGFFAGKINSVKDIDTWRAANLTAVVTNENLSELEGYFKSLQAFKISLDAKNETVVLSDKEIVLYNDDLGIAGTIDLLTYDNKGHFRIYDMKTMRGNQLIDTHKSGANKGKTKYDNAYNTGEDSNKVKHQKQLSLYRMLMYNTHGVLASELNIMPIVVSYNPGEKTTTKLESLPLIPVTPLTKVNTATLAPVAFQPEQTSQVEVVSRYTNADVKANPNKIYIFGDNTKQTGKGGQAVIRDNENAFGIPTKKAPSRSADAYFYDTETINGIETDMVDHNAIEIEYAISKIKQDGRPVVFPKDGLGTGLAKLKEKAPQTYAYLKQRLQEEFGFNNDTGVVSKSAQPASQIETGVVDFKPEDVTISNKLETFNVFIDGKKVNGTVDIKGYKIDIKNQPNVNLIATKYYSDSQGTKIPNGWQVFEIGKGLKLPLSGLPSGFAFNKKSISTELSSTLTSIQGNSENVKVLESVGFNFGTATEVISELKTPTKPKAKGLAGLYGAESQTLTEDDITKEDWNEEDNDSVCPF